MDIIFLYAATNLLAYSNEKSENKVNKVSSQINSKSKFNFNPFKK